MKTPSREDLIARINSFRYWHYPFDLGDGVVITPSHGWLEAARELRDFIWPTVVGPFGGNLKGQRVLDVGCNAGFWALEAHRSGASYVLGVDASQEGIDQATLVRDALGISPSVLEYRRLDVYDLSRATVGEFDLCLLFRVLHHLAHPLFALERLREVCRGILVIDVYLASHESPVLSLHPYDPTEPFCGVGRGLALKPSRSALELMVRYGGFGDLTFVPPAAPLTNPEYLAGVRAFFIARADTIS